MNQRPKLLTLPHPVRLHPGLRLEVTGKNGIGITTLSADNALSLGAQLVQEARESIHQGRQFAPFPQTLTIKSTPDAMVLQMSGGDTELTASLNRTQAAALADAAATKSTLLQFDGVVTATKLQTYL